jgi:hypothetical protein
MYNKSANKPKADPTVYSDQHGFYRRIPLTRDQYAIVDAHRFDELCRFNWYAQFAQHTKSFYARRAEWDPETKKNRTVGMVAQICGEKEIRDHADGNTLNNREYNLRPVSESQNACNRKVRSNSKSGFKGVTWHKRQKKYNVRITVLGKTIELGSCTDPKKGAAIYNAAAVVYHGPFAKLNII